MVRLDLTQQLCEAPVRFHNPSLHAGKQQEAACQPAKESIGFQLDMLNQLAPRTTVVEDHALFHGPKGKPGSGAGRDIAFGRVHRSILNAAARVDSLDARNDRSNTRLVGRPLEAGITPRIEQERYAVKLFSRHPALAILEMQQVVPNHGCGPGEATSNL